VSVAVHGVSELWVNVPSSRPEDPLKLLLRWKILPRGIYLSTYWLNERCCVIGAPPSSLRSAA